MEAPRITKNLVLHHTLTLALPLMWSISEPINGSLLHTQKKFPIKFNTSTKTFDLVALNYSVGDYKKMKDAYGKLTSLVMYNTNYFHKNSTNRVQIEFGVRK